jgi:hypothetical protein
MTISMLMRRTAAIAAAAIAISGVAAGQALASTLRASAPGHSVEKRAMYVAGAAAGADKASPAASGGGCSSSGQFASACINSLPGGCTGAYLSLFDITTQTWVEDIWIGCATGHFGPYSVGAASGHACASGPWS